MKDTQHARQEVTIQGEVFRRIAWGSPEEDWPTPQEHEACHDCGAKPGNLHEPGCDVERCPRCGGQWISCSCSDDDNCEPTLREYIHERYQEDPTLITRVWNELGAHLSAATGVLSDEGEELDGKQFEYELRCYFQNPRLVMSEAAKRSTRCILERRNLLGMPVIYPTSQVQTRLEWFNFVASVVSIEKDVVLYEHFEGKLPSLGMIFKCHD